MSEENAVRKIDELGRIVLPIEVRCAMGWEEKTPLTIQIEGGAAVLRRHASMCIYCGKIDGLKEYAGKQICPTCQSSIAAL